MIGHNPRIPPFLRPFISILLLLLIVMAGVTGQNVLRAQAIPDDEAEIAPVLVSETDILLRALILDQGLTGDPSRGRDLPSIDEPLAQLGKALFFTKALGGDMDSACASCHLPTLGGDDARALPIGVGAYEPDLLGPGRAHPEGGSTVPRNSPTTFNVGLWDKFLFHDGRVESLDKIPGANGAGPLGIRTPDSNFGEPDPLAGTTLVMAQSRFPVTSAEEMRGFDLTEGEGRQVLREYLAARIGGYGDAADDLVKNEWPALFAAVFGDGPVDKIVTEQKIARAISAYERSQVFVDSPWKAYVEGDETALSDEAKRGALLFFTPVELGGAGCAECHSGDFFTDENFHVLAVPQAGMGKGDSLTGTDDYGRFRETHRLRDIYAFRTPSLLNVEVTEPYGHSGVYETLDEVIRHHLDPAVAVAGFDWLTIAPVMQTEYAPLNTRKALSRLEWNRKQGMPSLLNCIVTDEQVAEMVAFLEALTDPCVKDAACLAPWMPGSDDPDPDGLRLNAFVNE